MLRGDAFFLFTSLLFGFCEIVKPLVKAIAQVERSNTKSDAILIIFSNFEYDRMSNFCRISAILHYLLTTVQSPS